MSIPYVWNFYHSKMTCLSYLRYLTLATCRYHHEGWPIKVYDIKDDFDWGFGDGDFQYSLTDYRKQAADVLGAEFKFWETTDPIIKDMPSQNQSDLFSYAILAENGGWYSDTDVLFLKCHQHLADQDYAFVGFGGQYYHVGMFGSIKGGWVMKSILEQATKNYEKGSYNSTGTYTILKWNATNVEWTRQFKEPDNGLRNYHLPDWTWVSVFPQDHARLLASDFRVDGNALALHLYGSMPTFGKLNHELNPDTIMRGSDIVSRTIQEIVQRDPGAKRLFLIK